MTRSKEILEQLDHISRHPRETMDRYLSQGKKVVLVAPYYTPEEIVDSFGIVPMGVWGADREIDEAKRYFPAFICAIVQTAVEGGMKGVYDGASAIIIPSLCDSLKVMGQNWKYAVPSIPFIPMTYPQNRKPDYARDFTLAGYQRIIGEMEKISGQKFDEQKLEESMKVYNEHNRLMREVSDAIAAHPEINAKQRNAVFRSATFMTKQEHNEILQQLLTALKEEKPEEKDTLKIYTTGILADAPALLDLFDQNNMRIVADDVAAESRLYKTDAVLTGHPLHDLADKFSSRDNDTLLYDQEKHRIQWVVDQAKEHHADGIVLVLTKFCDPEEFDYPFIKQAAEKAGVPMIEIETDRQMENYEQASTMLETFRELLETRK